MKFDHNACRIPVLISSFAPWFEAKVALLFGCYFPAVFVVPEQPDHKEPGSLDIIWHHCKKMQKVVLWCYVNFLTSSYSMIPMLTSQHATNKNVFLHACARLWLRRRFRWLESLKSRTHGGVWHVCIKSDGVRYCAVNRESRVLIWA